MVQSCVHVVVNFLRLPEPDQNMPYLPPYHWPVPNFATVSKSVEIPRKLENSVARLKISHSTE